MQLSVNMVAGERPGDTLGGLRQLCFGQRTGRGSGGFAKENPWLDVDKNERLVLRYPTMQRSGYHSR